MAALLVRGRRAEFSDTRRMLAMGAVAEIVALPQGLTPKIKCNADRIPEFRAAQ